MFGMQAIGTTNSCFTQHAGCDRFRGVPRADYDALARALDRQRSQPATDTSPTDPPARESRPTYAPLPVGVIPERPPELPPEVRGTVIENYLQISNLGTLLDVMT